MTLAMTSDALPLNAISCVVLVSGQFCHGWDGPHVPIVLQRVTVPTVELNRKSTLPRESLPIRPPSKLPPPGNLVLQVDIGPQIADSGRVGTVYGISCILSRGNENESRSYSLPPLVAKVARKDRSGDMKKEASFYHEMECLQGCAIPRCYGFFQMNSPSRPDFGPVSILILERLGERLPLGRGLMSIPPAARPDLEAIGADFAELGISHGDVRWDNILSAPTMPGSLPSLPSPFTGRPYTWRMVDFDRAEKTDITVPRLSIGNEMYLFRIFLNIPSGCIVEPWE